MASSIARKASSFRISGGSARVTKKRRVRRAVSFTHDVFLLSAIRDESIDEINRVLLEMEADQELDLNAVLVGGRSALHQAVLAARSDAIAMLLDRGAYVDVLDDNGWTPLHYAVDAGQSDAASLLVDRGADPRHPTLDGNNCLPMDIAIDQCDSEMMALLSDGITRAQHRPLLIVKPALRGSGKCFVPRKPGADCDDEEVSNETMDYDSTTSDFDNRSITSANSALFVPNFKRLSSGGTGPFRSFRKLRDRYRQPSPSPSPLRDSDVDTPEDGSFCTVNEFITDVFSNALRNAHCDTTSMSSATADDSQDSLASFPNSSDSPRSSFLGGGLENSLLRPVQTSSPALDSKTSSSSGSSEDSFHSPLSSMSSAKKLSHYNSNGSLVSTDQPAVVTSSSSPNSSSVQISSSGSSVQSRHSLPLDIPPMQSRIAAEDDQNFPRGAPPACSGSPSYDVPRSGVPRKFMLLSKHRDRTGNMVLGSSFDYDVPHSALRRPLQPSTLSPPLEAEGNSMFDLRLAVDESTLIHADHEDARSREDHTQITPQASVACDSPDLATCTDDRATPEVPTADYESLVDDDSEPSSSDLGTTLTISPGRHYSCAESSHDFASDSTLGVRSSNSVSRLSPECSLTRTYKIKDTFTSVQSLPTYRHVTPDECFSPQSSEPRSPLSPESTGSEDQSSMSQCRDGVCADHLADGQQHDYVSATLPWRGRHGGNRPSLTAVTVRHAAGDARKDTKAPANRLSAAEFLLSLSPSGPPALVEEVEEEDKEKEGVMSLLDFLDSHDPPDQSRSPSPPSDPLELSAEDFLLSAQDLSGENSRPGSAAEYHGVTARLRKVSDSDDQPRPDRPMSLVSDWMTPVGTANLSSHVATLPRGITVELGGFQRGNAARGSLRRLITKATTRTSKKASASTSSDSTITSAGSSDRHASAGSHCASPGSDDQQAADSSATNTTGRKSFLKRTSSLRNSFRSRKSKKLKSSLESDDADVSAPAKDNSIQVQGRQTESGGQHRPVIVKRRDRAGTEDSTVVANSVAKAADKRASGILTVSVTAL